MSTCLASCRTEGAEAERALLCGETSRLRAAAGFVLGGVLSGAMWSVIGLLTWCALA